MTEPLVILVLTTVGHLVLGVAVWLTQPRQAANRAFAMLCVALASWTLSNGLVSAYAGTPWGIIWARAAFASASVLPPSFVCFVSVFPMPTPAVSARLRYAVIGAGLGSFVVSLTPLIARGTTSVDGALHLTYGPVHPVFAAYFVAVLTYSLVVLARKLRVLKGVERLQVRYVFLGVGVTALGGTVTNLFVPLFLKTSRFSRYGPIFGVLMVLLIAHAIVRYRLMNIRVVVRRGMTELGAFGITAALLITLGWSASWLLSHEPRQLPLWVWLGLILAVAQVLQPLRRSIQVALDRYFFRDPYNYPRALREISRGMDEIIELPTLYDYVCRAIADTVHAEMVVLYASDGADSGYALWAVRRQPDATPPPSALSGSSPVIRWLEQERKPLTAYARYRHETGGEMLGVRDDLHRLGADCVVPIFAAGRLIGALVVGPKRSGDPYFTEDTDLLNTIASHVALAIKNARLYAQVVLAEADKRRTERLASIGALASGIAHEIKNPLVAIKTFAELLPERAGDEEFQGAFSHIVLQEIERIDHLVARLRGLAAPPPQQFVSIDLRRSLDETLTLLRGQVERTGITVRLTRDEGDALVVGEPDQLKQLFLNILLNAVEAMPDGGALSIRLAQPPSGQRVMVEIEDTGPGVPEELLPRIFEPFVTTKPQGSGLGLAICRAIADAHRASIRAQRNPAGRGTKIVIDFPGADTVRIDAGERATVDRY